MLATSPPPSRAKLEVTATLAPSLSRRTLVEQVVVAQCDRLQLDHGEGGELRQVQHAFPLVQQQRQRRRAVQRRGLVEEELEPAIGVAAKGGEGAGQVDALGLDLPAQQRAHGKAGLGVGKLDHRLPVGADKGEVAQPEAGPPALAQHELDIGKGDLQPVGALFDPLFDAGLEPVGGADGLVDQEVEATGGSKADCHENGQRGEPDPMGPRPLSPWPRGGGLTTFCHRSPEPFMNACPPLLLPITDYYETHICRKPRSPAMPDIDDAAPDFTLPRDGGGEVTLSELKGTPVVLYFYPKDNTPGCTKEAIAFSGDAQAFADAGAQVFGISKDSVKKHDNFVAKHGLLSLIHI